MTGTLKFEVCRGDSSYLLASYLVALLPEDARGGGQKVPPGSLVGKLRAILEVDCAAPSLVAGMPKFEDTRKFKTPTQHTGPSTSRGTPRTQTMKRRGRPPITRLQPPVIVSSSVPYQTPRGKPRSSRFNGVCRHAKSGRYEAHVWLRESRRQVYLGGHVEEEFAAEAFDIIVLKLSRMGDRSRTGSRPLKMNFPESRYADLIDFIDSLTLDELIMEVRRHSEGFARGASGYRGVTRHSESKYEARLGVPRNSHLYLGLFDSPQKAAIAYDTALVQARGRRASTNFPLHNYNNHIREYEMNMGRSPQADETYANKSK